MPYVTIYGRAPIKSQLNQYIRGVRRMAGKGMGQDPTAGGTYDDSSTGFTDPTLALSTTLPTTDLSDLGVNFNAVANSPTTSASSSLAPTDLPASLQTAFNNAYSTATSPASGGGFNIASFINSLSGAAAAAAKVYVSTESPYLIPGTNTLYNPATGSILGAGLSSTDMSSLLLYGGLALGAYLLITLVEGAAKK